MSELIKIEKKDILNYLEPNYDLFICSSSFDDRCLCMPKLVAQKQLSNVMICHFENNYECADINYEKLKEIFGFCEAKINTLMLKKDDPIVNYDLFFSEFSNLKLFKSDSILIDISTFTRENMLILLRFIMHYYVSTIKVTFCYSPSSGYPNWLSRGVKQIRSIFGYSGDFSPLKRLLLIVLVGFECERSQILIDSYEPAKLFIGKATSKNSISKDLSVINGNHYENLIRRNSLAEEFEFSCIDIVRTKNIILSIAKDYEEDFNIIIAPMSNKISTLGVAFAALENPTIQICYAATNQYNIDEKHGESDYFYCFELSDLVKENAF